MSPDNFPTRATASSETSGFSISAKAPAKADPAPALTDRKDHQGERRGGDIIFSRVWAMPNPNTLSIPPIAEFAKRHLAGRLVIIDPFAKDNEFGTHRNDLDPDTKAQWHLEAEEFLAEMHRNGVKADAGIVDPPYSPRQMSECYNKVGIKKGMAGSQNAALYKKTRDALMPLLASDAVVLSFGWNSAGMGTKRGFQIVEILMVAHGGAHNDTICVAEKRIQ